MGKRKIYAAKDFLFDCLMICMTGGLWFVWIFVREMRMR